MRRVPTYYKGRPTAVRPSRRSRVRPVNQLPVDNATCSTVLECRVHRAFEGAANRADDEGFFEPRDVTEAGGSITVRQGSRKDERDVMSGQGIGNQERPFPAQSD